MMTTHRADDISPHTRNALKRIGTGWRIRYTSFADFMVFNVERRGHMAFVCPTAEAALRSYMRLTSEASKGGAL